MSGAIGKVDWASVASSSRIWIPIVDDGDDLPGSTVVVKARVPGQEDDMARKEQRKRVGLESKVIVIAR